MSSTETITAMRLDAHRGVILTSDLIEALNREEPGDVEYALGLFLFERRWCTCEDGGQFYVDELVRSATVEEAERAEAEVLRTGYPRNQVSIDIKGMRGDCWVDGFTPQWS